MARSVRRVCGLWLCLGVLLAMPVFGQTPADTLRGALPEVRVETTRASTARAEAPYSVDLLARPAAVRSLDPGTSLNAALRLIPGVYLANRENPALGERLIVRGLGYRSAFGVRGVQVVLDGIPLTLADGQAVLNIVDPALVREVEVLRGPASALWGNSSGGVLALSTLPSSTDPRVAARIVGGSDGYRRVEGEGVVRGSNTRAGLSASYTASDGYRDYSGYRAVLARAFGETQLASGTFLRLVVAFEDTPRQEHPGALTGEDLLLDRRQAEARYVTSRSGKSSTQVQAGATLAHAFASSNLTLTVYGLGRRLDNPLPFAYIDLDRTAGGLRSSLESQRGALHWTVGVDAGWQRDARTNAPNEAGTRGTPRSLDQTETVAHAGAFARVRADGAALGWPQLSLEGALRADGIRFEAEDLLLSDGDQSGRRTLGAVSPMAGLTYGLDRAHLFASFATAFETPTTTELVNRPDGLGGFNPLLAPQRTAALEVGVRGWRSTLRYDVALYTMRVRDGLAPFEGENGRTFYRNVQQTRHAGFEVSADWRPSAQLSASAGYTFSRLRFGASDDPTRSDLEGRTLPGVPHHRFVAEVRGSLASFEGLAAVEAHTALYADDANTAQTDDALRVDLGISYDARFAAVHLVPFVRIANALDAETVGSVAINARGGRYYEPAAGRQLFAGVRVAW